MTTNRVPRGISTGGQFAPAPAAEATDVTLACDPAATEHGRETFEMLWCESCQQPFDETDSVSLYECGTCGSTGAERRCEQCNLFMARSEERGCPTCEEPVADEPVEVVHDHDGQIILAEDFDPHGASKAERDAERRAAAEEAAKIATAERLRAQQANVAVVRAVDLQPGTVLTNPDDASRFSRGVEVLSVRPVTTPQGPLVLIEGFDHEPRVLVRRPDAELTTKAVVDEFPTEGRKRDGGRLTAADFGGARLIEGFNPGMRHVSSPGNGIDVTVGPTSRTGGTVPALALVLGHRNLRGNLTGSVSYIGAWTNPNRAAEALNTMEAAADALERQRALHPAADHDDDRVPETWSAVAAVDSDWVSDHSSRSVEMEVGVADWSPEKGAVLRIQSGDGVNAALADPAMLRAAVAEARRHLPRLTGVPERPDVVDDTI